MLRFSSRRPFSVLLALGLLTALSAPSVVPAQNIIRGSAQNLSRGQPAAGDDVILIRLERMPGRGMLSKAEAQTKTDAQGIFLFQVRYPYQRHLIRVVHEDVTYDQPASVGDNLSIAVFDAMPKVSAVTGGIEILRVGTRVAANQELLHVSDMYEIRNESSPPMTQAGASTFNVYLPANAKIDSVLAAGPNPNQGAGQDAVYEQIGLMISATPVDGEPGHYTVNFPLRPGATKFAFNYDVPYRGHATFQTRHQFAFQQFAVMIPPSMHFSSRSSAFQRLATGNSEHQVQAAMQVKVGQGPEFEVSGNGTMPPFQAKNQAPPQSLVPNSTVLDSPRALPSSPLRSESKLEKTPFAWPSLVLTGCVFLVCALLILRIRNHRLARSRRTDSGLGDPENRSVSFLESLKEELFQLEADRARGSISAEEYFAARQALEENVKRAVVSGPRRPSAFEPEARRGAPGQEDGEAYSSRTGRASIP